MFSFWILKSHCRQYQSLKIKVEILYSHFGISNLTTAKTSSLKVFTFSNLEKKAFNNLKSVKKMYKK